MNGRDIEPSKHVEEYVTRKREKEKEKDDIKEIKESDDQYEQEHDREHEVIFVKHEYHSRQKIENDDMEFDRYSECGNNEEHHNHVGGQVIITEMYEVKEMEVFSNLEFFMKAYNLLTMFEKLIEQERLALPFARETIQLLLEGKIEEGFGRLSVAESMLHVVRDQPEYAYDYYYYLVEDVPILMEIGTNNTKALIGLDNEQEINVEKVSYNQEELKIINQVHNKVQNTDNIKFIDEK